MYREMRVYHKVRAFRTDIQAVCDSLVYNSKDSCMTMYTDPVLWYGSEQLLGEQIKVYMNDSTIDWAHIINQALTVEQKDTLHYNQVSGKEMKAYFVGGEMRQVDVNGNVLVIFYPVEERDSSLILMNYSEGGFLRMMLKDRKWNGEPLSGKLTVLLIRWSRFLQISTACLLLYGWIIFVLWTKRIFSIGGVKSRMQC